MQKQDVKMATELFISGSPRRGTTHQQAFQGCKPHFSSLRCFSSSLHGVETQVVWTRALCAPGASLCGATVNPVIETLLVLAL